MQWREVNVSRFSEAVRYKWVGMGRGQGCAGRVSKMAVTQRLKWADAGLRQVHHNFHRPIWFA